ncbi:Phytochelatin synthase-domain-containing protein [Radiomyces spectabilis]|uniref:Phytochelatin synthase-domain-containing protein n=1 Tax=Radiomyces spectabilis TaxID=64574 RepID=UPI00221F0523|nr:Phytochelatin synthase-domain-containing protein [Radiomyces spectabilis]KAI8378062.1 Phytochelatin synthase-domain-containing protein [Radiomyces spectabilis]
MSCATEHPETKNCCNGRSSATGPSEPINCCSGQLVERENQTFKNLLGVTTSEPDLSKSFYQRQLPTHLVRFASPEGKALFRKAMDVGHAENFFPLTGNFTTQSEPAFCGPSSLAMVLNALEVDPKRIWKGNWRWFSDELLDCCATTEQMKENGITFGQFACLAGCHANVVVKQAPTFTFEEFKQDVADVTARSDQFMVISFSRKTLQQTGDGHFSPIGAYNPENDMVLVLDTARYKYPSYWCDIKTLYESMKPIDKETGRPRGYFLLSYDTENPPMRKCKTGSESSCSLQMEKDRRSGDGVTITGTESVQLNWSTVIQKNCRRVPENIWLEKPKSLESAVEQILHDVPLEFKSTLTDQLLTCADGAALPKSANRYIDRVLQETTQSPLYSMIRDVLHGHDTAKPEGPDVRAAFATLFILGSPRMLFASLPRDVLDQLEEYRKNDYITDIVKRQVQQISTAVDELTKTFCTCGPEWMQQQTNADSACAKNGPSQ